MARTRTFVGIDVGKELRSSVAALQQALGRNGASVNWVPRENLHITLIFLGEVEDNDLHQVCRSVSTVAAGGSPFEMRIAGVGGFPTPRRPKTIWAGVTDGAAELAGLHAKLETRLTATGAYRREERAFTPHLTLGRVRSEADSQIVSADLAKFFSWSGGRTSVDEVVVYANTLRRSTPEYAVLAREPLRGSS